MSNTEILDDYHNRYKLYIQNLRFIKEDEVKSKAQKVFFKTLLICLYLGICGISSNYVFAVFFGDETRDFPVYFIEFLNSLTFYVGLSIIGFITTSIAIAIHKLNIYAYTSPIANQKRINKLFTVLENIPELESVVAIRLRSQGFISEMDYQYLQIDEILSLIHI